MGDIFMGVVLALFAFGGYLFYQFKIKNKEGEKEEEKYIPTTQDHIALDYIRSGIVKLKTGGYRLVIELPSVNIELMEPEEKEMILQQYSQILNAIDFPFQYLQQSRIVDITEYLSTLEGHMVQEKNPLIQKQIEFYSNFLQDIIHDRSVLTKKFYITIPYDEEAEEKKKQGYTQQVNKKDESKKKIAEEEDDVYAEEKRFEKARKQLYSRGTMIDRAFRRFDISPKILDDKGLLELFYTAYNKDRSVTQSLKHQDISDFTTMRVKTNKNKGRGK